MDPYIGDYRDRFGVESICRVLPIGDVPPAEYELAYYPQKEESAMAA